jgi:hypothetical protein
MNKLQQLKKKTDRLFQIKYKKLCCEICGKPAICCHHIVTKSLSAYLRYDPKNAISVCRYCHLAIHSGSDVHVQQRLIKVVGTKRMKYLADNRRKMVQVRSQKYYKKIIEELKGGGDAI